MRQQDGVDGAQILRRRQRRMPPQMHHPVAQQRVRQQPHAVEIDEHRAMPDPGHLRHGRRVCSLPRAALSTPSSRAPTALRRHVSAPAGARVLVGVAALAIDAALGEPPARLHPVVGMGSLLSAARRRWRAQGRRPASSPRARRASSPWLRPRRSARWRRSAPCARLPRGAALLGEAGALSTLLALRGLCEAVEGVRAALEAGDIDGRARARGARSREPRHLATRRERALGSRHPVARGEPQRLRRRAAAGLRRRWSARRRGLPRAQHRRRDVGLSHARAAAPRMGRGARRRSRQPRARPPHGAPDRRALAAAAARRCASRCATTGSHPRPTAAGRWRPWPAGSACASLKRDSYAFNAEAPAPVPADIALALGVVGG